MKVRYAILFVMMLTALGVPAARAEYPASPPKPFWGAAVDGYPVTHGLLETVEKEMGFFPQIVVFFLQWPASGSEGEFPRSSLDVIRSRRALPCITWEPFYLTDGEETSVSHRELLAGDWDDYLFSFAEACAAWGLPVIVRFAHEMNIERYHWGTRKAAYGPESPAVYREMFRYVVRAFQQAGATNVLWAFCPNAENVPDRSWDPSAGWNRAEAYYPGDAYVDILGMDGYNWGTTQKKETNGWQSHWRSFAEVFGAMHETLRALSPEKPLVVFETATAAEGGSKSQWIEEMVVTSRKWGLPGLVWFQVNKEVDWRLRHGGETVLRMPAETEAPPGSAQRWFERFLQHRRAIP